MRKRGAIPYADGQEAQARGVEQRTVALEGPILDVKGRSQRRRGRGARLDGDLGKRIKDPAREIFLENFGRAIPNPECFGPHKRRDYEKEMVGKRLFFGFFNGGNVRNG